MIKFRSADERIAWSEFAAVALAGLNAYWIKSTDANDDGEHLPEEAAIDMAKRQADSLLEARRAREPEGALVNHTTDSCASIEDETELYKLQKEAAILRAALAPFAIYEGGISRRQTGQYVTDNQYGGSQHVLTFEHFRAAADAFSRTEHSHREAVEVRPRAEGVEEGDNS